MAMKASASGKARAAISKTNSGSSQKPVAVAVHTKGLAQRQPKPNYGQVSNHRTPREERNSNHLFARLEIGIVKLANEIRPMD